MIGKCCSITPWLRKGVCPVRIASQQTCSPAQDYWVPSASGLKTSPLSAAHPGYTNRTSNESSAYHPNGEEEADHNQTKEKERTSVSEEPSLSITQYSARQNRHVRMYFALHASHVRPQPKQSRCTPTCFCGVLVSVFSFSFTVVREQREGEMRRNAALEGKLKARW